MTRAGKNTPQSVLAFIGVHLDRMPDPLELARDLGYDTDAIEHLQAKHGDELGSYLQRVQRARRDSDRYPARQQGRRHPQQYVSSHLGAIDDLACPPEAFVTNLAFQGAERLYEEMCVTRDAVKARLDNTADPLVAGELRRAHSQMVRACEKAKQRLAAHELDRAA